MAIESLFGPSVGDVQELRRQQQEREIAGAGKEFGMFAPLYQAGLRFGNKAANSINTLLGAQDPLLQEATAVQAVLSKFSNEDPSDPATLEKIGKELMSVAPDAGLRAISLSRQLTKDKKSPFGQLNPKDFTPESIKEFMKTGGSDYSVLREADSLKATKIGLTDSAIKLADGGVLPAGQAVYQQGDNQYILGPQKTRIDVGGVPLQGTGGTKVEVNLGEAMEKAMAIAEGKDQGAAWVKAGQAYRDNNQLIQTIDEFKQKAPAAFTGMGADAQKNVSKVFSALGVPVSEKATNTELLQSFQSQFVQKIAKNFPGSQAVKELEQLIASQPNIKQELPTIIRLLDRFRDERLAEQLTYKALDKLPQKERYNTNSNIIAVDYANKIQKYRQYQNFFNRRAPLPAGYSIEEAKQLQAELGLD